MPNRNSSTRLLRHFKVFSLATILTLIASALFMTLYTPAAAELTHHVLRPVLGEKVVIRLEKIFFDISDRFQRTGYRFKDPGSPLSEQEKSGGPAAALAEWNLGLDLEPIPITHGMKWMNGEGIWRNRPLAVFPDQVVMAYAFVRPDPDRAFAFTTLIQINSRKVRLAAVAGKKQPGGPVGRRGPGVVPEEIVKSGNLIAAFSGGFQYRDGEYGMIVGDTTYLPLKHNVGTLVGFRDGRLAITNYRGESLGSDLAFVRQNCPILIENGTIAAVDPEMKVQWGRTLTTEMVTWRSGIGLTGNGNIVYAVGNNLTPTTLGIALKMGGAVNAIQLDINPYWVRFNIFDPLGDGNYKSAILTRGLHDGSREFLNGYEKDFFYLYKR